MDKKKINAVLFEALNQILEEMTFVHVELMDKNDPIIDPETVMVKFMYKREGCTYLRVEKALIQTLFQTVFPEKGTDRQLEIDFIKELTQSFTGLFLSKLYPKANYTIVEVYFNQKICPDSELALQFTTFDGLKGEVYVNYGRLLSKNKS